MRFGRISLSAAVLGLLGCAGSAVAAPLPPVPPVDVCGKVRSAKWLPPETRPAVPGMSGSAGRQRSWPGRFVVVLGATRGIVRSRKEQINRLLLTSRDGGGVALRPGQLLLVLPDEDPALLKRSDRICVTGFTVSGDEGGTWTRYEKLRFVGR